MKFSDVIGQNDVKRRLLQMCAEGRVPHAMLFLGTEGAGALPLAYAFAQYLGCTGDKSHGDSCGECPSCRKQAKLVHPDVHHIFPFVKNGERDNVDSYLADWRAMVSNEPYFSMSEWVARLNSKKQSVPVENDDEEDAPAASSKKKNTGKQAIIPKDAAEAIHEKLCMKPYEAEKQILVLWRPELMNEATSNSLLKILEEPPSDTIFILVAEDSEAILPTILSRTQMFRVPPVAESDMADLLRKRYAMEPDEATRVAHISQGSFVAARKVMTDSLENSIHLEVFKKIMRSAYARDVVQMSGIADDFRAMTREQAKSTLFYCQKMIRESFVMNLGRAELNFLNADEEAFLSKFAPFVHVGNAEKLASLIDTTIAQVEQNGNLKMVALEMVLNLTALIRNCKRPSASFNS